MLGTSRELSCEIKKLVVGSGSVFLRHSSLKTFEKISSSGRGSNHSCPENERRKECHKPKSTTPIVLPNFYPITSQRSKLASHTTNCEKGSEYEET